MNMRALVADIGGTNTRLALADGAKVLPGSVQRYKNVDLGRFEQVLDQYLRDIDTARSSLQGACVAAAGPVAEGVVRLTNLNWEIGHDLLQDVLGIQHSAVLNDLQAQGHALGQAAPGCQTEIIPGTARQNATQLVVGIGTGFNVAPVYETPAGRMVMASEAGHISLPEPGPDAAQLARYLEDRYGFASVEEALSGRGLGQVDQALGAGRDAPALMQALKEGDASAERSVRCAVDILGAVVGDLALISLPFGGITLVGGVARHLTPWLKPFGFAEAVHAKGRFGPFLSQIPVSVVSDDDAALTGCATHLHALT